MNNIFKQFTAYNQIFEEHEKETCNLIQIFTELFEELYKFMGYAYTIFNDSENAMKRILHELLIMEKLRRFDKNALREIKASIQKLSEVKNTYKNEDKCISSEVIGFKGKVKEERKRLEENKPNIDMVESPNYADLFSSEVTYFKKYLTFFIAIFAKEVAQEVNPSKIKRVDNLSESLQTINRNMDELLKMTFNLYQNIDKSILDIENYILSVNRLLKQKEKNQEID